MILGPFLVHLDILSLTLRPSLLLRGVLQAHLDPFGAGGGGERRQGPGASAAGEVPLSAPDRKADG